jgi:HKD family nuclease
MKLIAQPISGITLGETLIDALTGSTGQFSSLRAAVAFVKSSGVQHIAGPLRNFAEKAEAVELIVGVDHKGTTSEGLDALLDAVGVKGQVFINHDENSYVTFHPKVFLLQGEHQSLLVVGSGNLTEGGLFTNDECGLVLELNPNSQDDAAILDQVNKALDAWRDEDSSTVALLA